MTNLTPEALRAAFGSFMTGVTIVTARKRDGTPVGFTANSFSSVSLDPPMLLVCPGKFLSSYAAFQEAEHFGVSILAEDQQGASNIFASSKADRFEQVPTTDDCNRVPLIDGAIAQFSCKTHNVIEAGDHSILLGEIQDVVHQSGNGLGFVGGRYFSLGLEQHAGQFTKAPVTCGAIIETPEGVLLENTPQGYRPIQVTVADHGNLRDALTEVLEARGIEAELHQVYSAFDSTNGKTKFTYFLGTTEATPADKNIEVVPVDTLPAQSYVTSAISNMMSRYATEARTRDFFLYVGDENAGDIHPLSQRK